MNKKTIRTKFNDDYDDYDHNPSGHIIQLIEHRKTKRLKNALKSKNVDDLLNLDEYY